MRNLNDTLRRLATMRTTHQPAPGARTGDRLKDLAAAGPNPGALRGRYHVPDALPSGSPLVVVLHGCTQDAAGYDHGSGWSHLADAHGFALLYPEQQRANNANLCFNWFSRGDTRRDAGEVQSIREMIMAMIADHAIDPTRVYITGLSAGGAMANVMLAVHPELFAGGAIIAGLPFGTATSIPEAFDRMRAHGGERGEALTRLVTAASSHAGPWPKIAVWHGNADTTVDVANAALILDQWRPLHGVAATPAATEPVDGHVRSVWRNAAGDDVIEEYRIAGLGHGVPLSTAGQDGCGVAGPYMIEAGISSTRHIARSWGLCDGAPADRASKPVAAERPPAADGPVERQVVPPPTRAAAQSGPDGGVGRIIDDALRAAGLMR